MGDACIHEGGSSTPHVLSQQTHLQWLLISSMYVHATYMYMLGVRLTPKLLWVVLPGLLQILLLLPLSVVMVAYGMGLYLWRRRRLNSMRHR